MTVTQAAPLGDGLPEIVISNRQLDDLVSEAVSAIERSNGDPWIYLRAGRVTSVVRDEDGRPLLREMDPDAFLERLALHARFFKNGKKSFIDTEPRRTLAVATLKRFEAERGLLPGLRGITETPLLRSDGSVLDRPGYDRSTRLVYVPPADFLLPPVPENPTGDQVHAAVVLLSELIADFPFIGDADRATAIAAVLTPLLMELIQALAPLFLVDAPAPGTGKSLEADAVSIIATGELGGKMAEPDSKSDEEWRKRLTAILRAGRVLCILDNVERPIRSASLATVLTTDTWTDRVLGKTQEITLPNRTVWIATGNNIRLGGDLARRCVWCRMDAKLARPWTRDGFRHPDLLAWARANRGEILAGAFTLARAWIAAGRPKPSADVPRLGGFERWREVIGGILQVAGVHGFLGNLGELYESKDPAPAEWAEFLAAWHKFYGESPVAAAGLVEDLRQDPRSMLREAIPGEIEDALGEGKSPARRIGRALARKAETRFPVGDGGATLRLVKGRDEGRNAATWRVLS